MQGFTKDQIISILDAYIPDDGTVIRDIGIKGEYLYLCYHEFTESGIIEYEEHILPDDKESTLIVTSPNH